MSENSTLRIHTQFRPDAVPATAAPKKRKKARSDRPRTAPKRVRVAAPRPRPGFSDRLLRNSAIACAALLGILALGNIDQPWAEKASEGIEKALTMHINLDDTLGELTFVRQIMPESALVFLNVSGSTELTPPVNAALVHPWSNVQPWLLFDATDRPVCAPASGEVTAVSPLSDGRFGLLIDHGEGLESVCAGLSEATVAAGDRVARGQQLGIGADALYYELRQDGESIDPSERLGL